MIIGLFLAVLLKMVLLSGCYAFVRPFFRTRLESAVLTYLASLVVQNGVFLLLSPFHRLTPLGIVLGYLLCAGVLWTFALWMRKKKEDNTSSKTSIAFRLSFTDGVALFLFALLFVGLLLRPFFYFDTTDDALIQGMPKLAFMEQQGTLFVHYDSMTVNTFSNEWLGELNGLYYMLLVGEDMAAGFGNVEMYLFIAVSFVYTVRAFGYRGKYTLPLAFFALSMPVLTGLVMTIKTDLVSIALLPLAAALLMEYYRTQKPSLLFASIVAIGATAASKISVLPGAGLLLIALVIFYFSKAEKKPVRPVLLGALCALVLCNRYVINLFQYGNPFQRALNEKMSFSLANFGRSLIGIKGEFFEAKELIDTLPRWSSSNWVLTKGFGYCGILCLVLFMLAAVFAVLKRKQNEKCGFFLLWIGTPVFLGFCFFCASSVWYDWSFRYVVPYIMVLLFASFAALYRAEEMTEGKRTRILSCALVCVLLLGGACNALSLFRTGQAYPYAMSEESFDKTRKKLAYASSPKYADLAEVPGLLSIFENGGSCLLFDTFSYPYYHFFGDNHCVKVDLAYDEDALIEQAFDKDYTFYVIATTREDNGYEKARTFFAEHGFVVYETTSGLIFMKAGA